MNGETTRPSYKRHRFPPEIVCPQMTKTDLLAARTGRDDVADLDRLVGHDDAVDQQFDELALLREGSVGEPGLHAVAGVVNLSRRGSVASA